MFSYWLNSCCKILFVKFLYVILDYSIYCLSKNSQKGHQPIILIIFWSKWVKKKYNSLISFTQFNLLLKFLKNFPEKQPKFQEVWVIHRELIKCEKYMSIRNRRIKLWFKRKQGWHWTERSEGSGDEPPPDWWEECFSTMEGVYDDHVSVGHMRVVIY